MSAWTPRFSLDQITGIASRYDDPGDDVVIEAGRCSRAQGFVSYDDFLKMCRWKTPRNQPHCKKNTAEEVEETTGIAMSASNERVRIGVLRCLEGVDWPTASVLLHLAHSDPYPVLDVRALWSLCVDQPSSYNHALCVRMPRPGSGSECVDANTGPSSLAVLKRISGREVSGTGGRLQNNSLEV